MQFVSPLNKSTMVDNHLRCEAWTVCKKQGQVFKACDKLYHSQACHSFIGN